MMGYFFERGFPIRIIPDTDNALYHAQMSRISVYFIGIAVLHAG